MCYFISLKLYWYHSISLYNPFQNIDVWYRAASQILLSLSLGLGSQFALCSFNNFKNNTIRDAILIACCNSATSIYAGFTVFAIMGFLAKETETTVDKVESVMVLFKHYSEIALYVHLTTNWNGHLISRLSMMALYYLLCHTLRQWHTWMCHNCGRFCSFLC